MFTTHHAVSRRTFLGAFGGAAALAALPSRALAGSFDARPTDTLLDWDDAGEGAWVLADLSTGGNTLVLADRGEALLVDTKFPYYAAALLRDARTLAGAGAVTMINTHHHADHTAGNPLVVPHARSYAHANAIGRIKDQIGRIRQAATGGPAQLSRTGAPRELVDLAIDAAQRAESWGEDDAAPRNAVGERGETVVGSLRVEMHHFGAGHTDNDLVVRVAGRNIVHTGDLVFHTVHPFYDASAGVDAFGWIESLEKTLALCDADTLVVPGHGPVGDRSIIEGMRTYHARLIEEVKKGIDAGATRDELAERSWDFMDGLGFESIRTRAIGAVYDQLTR